jgi:hypothetical protein
LKIEPSEKNDSRSLGASVCRDHRGRRYWLVVAAFAVGLLPAHAQLLDRVVARVGGTAITQTDVDAAVGLGVIEADGAGGASATQQMIDRRILLAEVARFPPADPSDSAIAELSATMKARAGAGYDALLKRTGLDDQRVGELARDTLRIQAYIDQRFGTSAQASAQEARDYYETHRDEFTRNGALAPFESVEAEARQAASATRRRAAVAQWLQGLRARTDVVTPRPSQP